MHKNSTHKICITIEARMESSRLPGKVMLPLAGKPMLQQIIERVSRSQYIDEVVVATTLRPMDEVIVDLCRKIQCKVYRGSVENIAERIMGACELVQGETIVQLTGDNPCVDHRIIDKMIDIHFSGDYDYTCNNLEPSYPRGLDVRMFSKKALRQVLQWTEDPIDLVHGSYFIYRRPDLFNLKAFQANMEDHWPDLRLTVDEPADYQVVQFIYETLYEKNIDFNLQDIIQLLTNNADIVGINKNTQQKAVEQG